MQEMDRVKKLIILTFIGFVIFFIGRIALYIVNFESFKDISLGTTILAFLHGFRFDAAILMTFFCPIIVLLLLPINNKIYYKIVMWLAYIEFVFFTLFTTIDIIYYKESLRHLTNELFFLGNESGFIISVVKTYWMYVLFLIILFTICGFIYKRFIDIKTVRYYFSKRNLLKTFRNFIIATIIVVIMIRGSFAWMPISPINAYVLNDANAGNLTLNGLFTSFLYMRDYGKKNMGYSYIFFDNKDYAKEVIKSHKGNNHSIPKELPKKPNIIFILLEGIHASDITKEITPNMYKMAEEGLNYINHQSPAGRSIHALAASLAGIAPLNGMPELGFGLEGIAKGFDLCTLLEKDGYKTIIMQASLRNSFYVDKISTMLGCKEYYGREDFPKILDYPEQEIVWGTDYEMFHFATSRLKKMKKGEPFFSFLFTASTHLPFIKPPKELELISEPYTQRSGIGFKNSLYYVDYSIGKLIEGLEKEDFFTDTIFIISADHSRGGNYLYEKTNNVPLIVWYSGVKHNEIDFYTNHEDMPATILDMAGIYTDREKYVGDSIFYKDENSFSVINRGSVSTILKKDKYLTTSLSQTIQYSPKDMDNKTKEELEELIKAYYEAQYRKITGR